MQLLRKKIIDFKSVNGYSVEEADLLHVQGNAVINLNTREKVIGISDDMLKTLINLPYLIQ